MLTDKMREAFGYDMFGNCEMLQSEQDKLALFNVPRAGGGVVCGRCGVAYDLHPRVQGALWATRTCDAGIVKL